MEDMLVGVRTESAWLRLVQQGARMELQEVRAGPSRTCPICTDTTGLGDAAPLVGRRVWEQAAAAEGEAISRRAS